MIGARIEEVHALPDGAAARFDGYHALLCEWNRVVDLTAVTDAEEALHRHYLDSLTALPFLPEGGRVVDVGTGAGFPGVPLAIARPDLSVVLLDALKKRVVFLRRVVEALALSNALPVHERAETYAVREREAFDVAVSRAVAPLPLLLELCLPLVKVGGWCVFWKGPAAGREIAEAERVAPLLGGGGLRRVDVSIPGRDFRHVLVLVDKMEATGPKFPRRAGMAAKKPL